MSSSGKSIGFAAILCVACSVLLTAASTGLKSFQQRNMAVDRQKNILMAVGLVHERQRTTQSEIQSLYAKSVQSLWVDRQGHIKSSDQAPGNLLPLYVYVQQDRIQAYVVPVNTRGLWGQIHGYLALENDGATIRGFTVYKHSETPGLGGEIESRWFRKNFEDKKIVDSKGKFVSIGVAKGAVKDVVPEPLQPNYVDGISGATMTGRFLSSGLKTILRDYEPMAIEFRHKNPRYLRVN
ncbi:MAG: FMN-binding protein [Desulfobacteraceae bacterium]|jgi:Na+-transporting NADH:ubiquinone oxidoreductase subunit C